MKRQKWEIFFLFIESCVSILYSSEDSKHNVKQVRFTDDTKITDAHRVLKAKPMIMQEDLDTNSIAAFACESIATKNFVRPSQKGFQARMNSAGFDRKKNQNLLEPREINFEVFMNAWNAAREKEFYERNKKAKDEDNNS